VKCYGQPGILAKNRKLERRRWRSDMFRFQSQGNSMYCIIDSDKSVYEATTGDVGSCDRLDFRVFNGIPIPRFARFENLRIWKRRPTHLERLLNKVRACFAAKEYQKGQSHLAF
jgi:hypothetical protein